MNADMIEAVEKWAEDEFRSVNGQILWILEQALKKNGRLKNDISKINGQNVTID